MKRRRKYPIITECRWLPWSQPVPEGWTECPPIAHHAFYARLITREVVE
jgi:hypothetical protein